MAFLIILVLANLVCFLPLYLLNFREQPNPFAFIADGASWRTKFRRLYAKPGFTDPIRVNFDFTFVILLAAATDSAATGTVAFAAALLAFGVIETLYASIMHSVFRRPPAIVGDLSLLRTGLKIAQGHVYWIIFAAALAIAVIVALSYVAASLLLELRPQSKFSLLLLAAILTFPCFHHWRLYAYSEFLFRSVYSPILHFYRNVTFSRRVEVLLANDPDHFEKHNHFKRVVLHDEPPSIIAICVESYGSIVYTDDRFRVEVQKLITEYEPLLERNGYRFASTYSEAPIFAGGSWASYASFTYGALLKDLQLFDWLFTRSERFACYESLFHVLKRNGYKNFLLCPLGAPDMSDVDWDTINRCFQSDQNFDFESLEYRGRVHSYFGVSRWYAAPDQFSLNFAYERAKQSCEGPFSLFFCTLNSHFPWDSPIEAVSDWRSLNNPTPESATTVRDGVSADRYRRAILYQLDYILKFIADHPDDDLLVVLFGDHQPPFLTSQTMGKQTPVHVIGRNPELINVLKDHGFHPLINLGGSSPTTIRHEGFLSLFMKALNAAYGRDPDVQVEYRERGVVFFDEH